MTIYKIRFDKETADRLEICSYPTRIPSLNTEIKKWLNENVGNELDIYTLAKASLYPDRNYH